MPGMAARRGDMGGMVHPIRRHRVHVVSDRAGARDPRPVQTAGGRRGARGVVRLARSHAAPAARVAPERTAIARH